jgi:NAD(P)-dependent dehydrogenase (short-subunit alcohol dehydrogenase family)
VTDEDRQLLTTPPSLRLDGKVAWVTGASRGLGRTLAFAFAGAGAAVLLTARSADALGELADELRDGGVDVAVVAGSVSDATAIAAAIDAAGERWGRLDVLVNNAGISPSFVRAERLDMDVWRDVLDVNLSAPLVCARAALPLMEAAGGGSIVNVSSVHGARAHERLIAYAASKGGVEMVTRTLAVEWAPRGIRVNSVAPGYLETEMTVGLREHERWRSALLERIPLGRFGTTDEVAGAVLFLAGDASRYVTGTTLFVDGGWTAL